MATSMSRRATRSGFLIHLRADGGPARLVRRLCCDGAVVPIVDGSEGDVRGVGRQRRSVPTGLKRALFARDRGCTFPGCHHTRFLDAHHVEHWADGGETNLANLLMLCSTHHKLVHEGGFDVKRYRHGRYFFTRPDARPVEFERLPDRVTERRAVYRLSSVSAEYECAFSMKPRPGVFSATAFRTAERCRRCDPTAPWSRRKYASRSQRPDRRRRTRASRRVPHRPGCRAAWTRTTRKNTDPNPGRTRSERRLPLPTSMQTIRARPRHTRSRLR